MCVSSAMTALLETARRAASSPAKVLITGESGVGKDLIARQIHIHSDRCTRPFVALNCAGLPETLLESELFGHVKGSFTGAYRDKPGKLQLAHRGTLFLDEVGDMSLRMQALLLRFLESGEIQPLGMDGAGLTADVRVIAATNRDLADRVATGHFREDLFYRLRVIHLRVPALRDRSEDVPALAEYFASLVNPDVRFTSAASNLLVRYRWPGNVRELQNVVEQAIWLAAGPVLDVADLQPMLAADDNHSADDGPGDAAGDRLYELLTSGSYTFWEHVHPQFLARDITRAQVRQVVHRALVSTKGNYRAVLPLLGIADEDYKRFLNFLSAHDCSLDVRPYRAGHAMPPSPGSTAGSGRSVDHSASGEGATGSASDLHP
ncbi:MAG: sigma-54 dependent transcriptional regulator [Vicinamibacterales bacterium]